MNEKILALNEAKTHSEVIKILVDAGIKGDRNKCKYCPVAEYIKQQGFDAYVGHSHIDYANDSVSEILHMSQNLMETIRLIDRGFFPEVLHDDQK